MITDGSPKRNETANEEDQANGNTTRL